MAMKKYVCVLLSGVSVAFGLVACSSNTEEVDEAILNNPPSVVDTLDSVKTKDMAVVAEQKTLPVVQDEQNTPAEDSETAQAERPYYVAEAFAVGREVYVRSLEISDAAKKAWVGTSVGVLEVDLDSRDVKGIYTRREGLANEYVFAILNDSENRTWFGTNGGGVSQHADNSWKTYFPMHGLADYWVYSFAEQADKSIWMGTWAGANHFNPETGEFKTYLKELINEWVYGIAVDKDSQVWFGTEGGVSMFDGKDWASWTHEDGLGAENVNSLPISTNTGLGTRSRHDLGVLADGQETYNPGYVFSILVDQQGDIWAGTWGGGVSRFDGDKWHSFNSEDGLAGNVVFSIAQDVHGVFWFGTDKGVSSFDGVTWHTYDRKDGLLSNSVYALHAVANGELWVGTKSGVARMAPRVK